MWHIDAGPKATQMHALEESLEGIRWEGGIAVQGGGGLLLMLSAVFMKPWH